MNVGDRSVTEMLYDIRKPKPVKVERPMLSAQLLRVIAEEKKECVKPSSVKLDPVWGKVRAGRDCYRQSRSDRT